MPGDSAIEWTDATWNPVTGCSRVSPGCEYCYAERLSTRFGRTSKPWGAQHAAENVVLHPDRLELPLRWTKPRRVFVNSMSDLFHERVSDGFIIDIWCMMALNQRHTFQVLTKRPERMAHLLGDAPLNGSTYGRWFERAVRETIDHTPEWWSSRTIAPMFDWPLPNVWLGVSTEDQERADERIPWLIDTPAAVRFLSCEPLLGPIDLARIPMIPKRLREGDPDEPTVNALTGLVAGPDDVLPHIDWVIVGGESGGPAERRLTLWDSRSEHVGHTPGAQWVRSLRDQCTAAGVAFFFKQWGGPTPKAGGRLLDGRTWDEYPAVAG